MATGTLTDLEVAGGLRSVRLRGEKLKAELLDATVSASLDASTSEVTELRLEVDDPGLKLAARGLFAGRPSVDYGPLALEVAAFEVNPGATGAGGLSIAARPRVVGRLRRLKGPRTYAGLSPSQLVEKLVKEAGGRTLVEPSPTRSTITIAAAAEAKEAETGWSTFDRLARELGYVVYEAAGVVYFGRPTWLLGRLTATRLEWKGEATGGRLISLPTCRRTADDPDKPVTIDLELDPSLAARVLPGSAIDLRGIPGFDGRYLVDQLGANLGTGDPVSLTASTPIDPEPQPPEAPPNYNDGGDPAPITVAVPGPGGGGAAGGGGWWDPMPGPITSVFGAPRPGRLHAGVDISGPTGTRIVAARPGVVSFVGWAGGYGNLIKIDHGGGIETRYAHLQRFAVGRGARVNGGQLVGYCNNTGNSTGPHLHFEVRVGGVAKNPLNYIRR